MTGRAAAPPVRRRGHAARVALVATVVVAAGYVLCVFGLNQFVNHRLVGQVDTRLRSTLAHEVSKPVAPGSPPLITGDRDTDNDPVFLWKVGPSGVAQALTAGAPDLARGAWTGVPVTVTLGPGRFRLDGVRVGSLWVVAGQSVAADGRVDDALFLPALLFGILLTAAVFVGSFIVGLRASAPLEQVQRRQAEFTADASHELRTTLSVVEAEVDLALRRRRSPDEYQAVLERIGAEGRRLRRIVEDLLWLARADAGVPGHDQGERADVAAVAAACVDRFQALAEQRGVSLWLEREGEAPAVVQAATEWVDRLAGVLIDNACKYAGPGGTAIVSVVSAQGRVVLRVDDSGPGIPLSERRAVFDRFHRATTEAGGAGLGLAIADSVVRMSGASWTVGEAPLGGARLAVSWRRAASRSDGAPGPGQGASEPALRRPDTAAAGRPGRA